MKVLLVLGLFLILGVLALLGYGRSLPRSHEAEGSALLPLSPSEVRTLLEDLASMPRWRTGLQAVELGPGPGIAWTERTRRGRLDYFLVQAEPGVRVVQVVDPRDQFGGTWTFKWSPEGSGTRLTIREDGYVNSPLFRVVAKHVLGYEHSINIFLQDLGKAGRPFP